MKLSKRLACIAGMVSKNSILADIGCDHGLLPISLIQQGVISKAYACDINPQPLQRAEEAITQANCCGTISTILSDGLQQVPSDADCIVIAGMGFETIRNILENGIDRLYDCQEIIVQPNTDVREMRSWISAHRFLLMRDQVIQDGHFYHILKFCTKRGAALTEDELLFGKNQDSADFLAYCMYERHKTEEILDQLSPSHDHYKKFLYYKEKLLEKTEKMDYEHE